MVKHIVMFKLKDSLSENEKIEIMNSFQIGYRGSAGNNQIYKRYSCRTKHQPSGEMGYMPGQYFRFIGDVKAYSVHPAHVSSSRNYQRCEGRQSLCGFRNIIATAYEKDY